MSRILITGVTGFVGTNLVKYLNRSNDYIFGHSRDVEKARQLFSQDRIEISKEYSASIFNELKIDCIIHLAGIAHDLSNKYTPEDYYQVNYQNTVAIYNEFLKSNASKFIFLSSIKALMDTSPVPATEDLTPKPITDYGKSKLKAEEYIQSRQLTEGKYFYIFRPCMMHGPGNKGNLNLLYRFAKTGVPYPFGAFQNQRSFLSIDNFTFIAQKFVEGNLSSGIYHLADDGFLSTNELYVMIANALRKHPTVLRIPKSLIQFVFSVVGKKHMLNKLTEDLMVSNKKLLEGMKCQLPVQLQDGLIKTIKSLDE